MNKKTALRVVLGYTVLAGLWIVLSGILLNAVLPSGMSTRGAEILKGLFFVAVTATVLYSVLRTIRQAESSRYRAVFENHHAPMLLIEPADGLILDANPAAADFYGWSRDRLMSMRISDINVLPAEIIQTEMARAKIVESGIFHFRHRLADGSIRDVEVFSGPVLMDGHTVLYSIVYDETDRKAAAQLLQRQKNLYAAMSEINTTLLRLPGAEEIYATACQIAVQRVGFLFASVSEIDTHSATIRLVEKYGNDQGYLEASHISMDAAQPLGQGPTGQAIHSGQPLISNNYLNDPATRPWHEAGQRAGVRASGAFPIFCEGRVVAVLAVYSCTAGFFDEAVQDLLQKMTGDISFALENDLRQRSMTETREALAVNEARWRFALDGAGHGVWEWNLQTGQLYFSREWKAMLDYADDELANELDEWTRLVHPEDLAAAQRAIDRYVRGETTVYDIRYRLRCKNGEYKWILDRGKVLSRDAAGQPVLFVGTHTDITEQKQAEESLARSEARFRRIFNEAPLGVALIDSISGQIMDVNAMFAQIAGRSQEQMLAINWQSITHPEDVQPDLDNMVLLNAGKVPRFSMKKRYLRPDGSVVWISMTVAPVEMEGESRPWHLCMIEDITEREQMLRDLKAQEERFRALADQSIVGIYMIDDGFIRYANPRAAAIFGYGEQEFMGLRALDVVAAKDLSRVQENLRRRLSGESESIQYEFLGLRKDGATAMIGVHGNVATIGGKRVIIGVMQDITEKLRIEAEIREYAKRMERTVLGAVDAMSTMVELRDPYTSGHERRVGEISAAIAAEMGFDESFQRGLRVAGAVHDVGKIAVPTELLTKPTRLTSIEMQMVREHAAQGYEVLKAIDFPWPVAEVARQHHERIDGSGYPRGLKGEDILIEARILAVADVVESMATHRPYRPSLGIEVALAEIESNSGRLYDAKAAAACLRLFRERGYTFPP